MTIDITGPENGQILNNNRDIVLPGNGYSFHPDESGIVTENISNNKPLFSPHEEKATQAPVLENDNSTSGDIPPQPPEIKDSATDNFLPGQSDTVSIEFSRKKEIYQDSLFPSSGIEETAIKPSKPTKKRGRKPKRLASPDDTIPQNAADTVKKTMDITVEPVNDTRSSPIQEDDVKGLNLDTIPGPAFSSGIKDTVPVSDRRARPPLIIDEPKVPGNLVYVFIIVMIVIFGLIYFFSR